MPTGRATVRVCTAGPPRGDSPETVCIWRAYRSLSPRLSLRLVDLIACLLLLSWTITRCISVSAALHLVILGGLEGLAEGQEEPSTQRGQAWGCLLTRCGAAFPRTGELQRVWGRSSRRWAQITRTAGESVEHDGRHAGAGRLEQPPGPARPWNGNQDNYTGSAGQMPQGQRCPRHSQSSPAHTRGSDSGNRAGATGGQDVRRSPTPSRGAPSPRVGVWSPKFG
jgi:hypothetical protein